MADLNFYKRLHGHQVRHKKGFFLGTPRRNHAQVNITSWTGLKLMMTPEFIQLSFTRFVVYIHPLFFGHNCQTLSVPSFHKFRVCKLRYRCAERPLPVLQCGVISACVTQLVCLNGVEKNKGRDLHFIELASYHLSIFVQ